MGWWRRDDSGGMAGAGWRRGMIAGGWWRGMAAAGWRRWDGGGGMDCGK
ncbi:hypothetical protein [Paenibacillus riograndensis]|nr:hypothetical protein [Paenibacillus riograndensis]